MKTEKKPTIDFIKWIIERAAGFEYSKDGDYIEYPDRSVSSIKHIESEDWKTIQYPLLLQRAIEGVNRESDKWIIIQTNAFVRLVDKDSAFKIPEVDYKLSRMTPDQAKENSLMYIRK